MCQVVNQDKQVQATHALLHFAILYFTDTMFSSTSRLDSPSAKRLQVIESSNDDQHFLAIKFLKIKVLHCFLNI